MAILQEEQIQFIFFGWADCLDIVCKLLVNQWANGQLSNLSLQHDTDTCRSVNYYSRFYIFEGRKRNFNSHTTRKYYQASGISIFCRIAFVSVVFGKPSAGSNDF